MTSSTPPDKQTVAFYDKAAADYAGKLGKWEGRKDLTEFIALLPNGGRVLDLGCGPGGASATMAKAGLDPDPVDASEGMVRFATETHGLPARIGDFSEDWGKARYDGVWASYCLLHAPEAELPGIVARLCAALRPGGAIYIGMKLGEGQARDRLERLYTYVTQDQLTQWLAEAGLRLHNCATSTVKGMAGTLDPCIDLIAVKD